jgi:hypothetical protein
VKKSLAFSILFLVALAGALLGDRMVARTLDARLAPLLTRQLGLPVTLEPITARVMTLKVTSARLVMGDPANPAVVATNVQVGLSLAALLDREIRLDVATAGDLMVNPSLWPSTGGPLPADYLFLDPWLPKTLTLETGRYVLPGGNPYPVRDFRWERNGDAAAGATWLDARGEPEFEVAVSVTSLRDLLLMQPLTLALETQLEGNASSHIRFEGQIAPAAEAAYAITGTLAGADLTADIRASGQTAWNWPNTSETHIDHLRIEKLQSVIESYRADSEEVSPGGMQTIHLPALNLPGHTGAVRIDRIQLGKELGTDTAFDFQLGTDILGVTNIVSHGPTGTLGGKLAVKVEDGEWLLDVDGVIEAREDSAGVAAEFLGAAPNWYWQSGHSDLAGRGNTLGVLLDSLKGSIALKGFHRGAVDTPIEINATLTDAAESFDFHAISARIGAGVVTGSADLSGRGTQRKLTVRAQGEKINVGFLATVAKEADTPGIPIPEYLGILPQLELDVSVDLADFEAPGLSLARAKAHFLRNDTAGSLDLKAEGKSYGSIALLLTASYPEGETRDFKLMATLDRVDVDALFQQGNLLHERTSGTVTLSSEGEEMIDIFRDMRGRADLTMEIRPDDDWDRAQKAKENLSFSGDARLVLRDERIAGIEIRRLDVALTEQSLTGTLAMVAGAEPWLTADLESSNLNITELLELLPESTEEADRADLLETLRLLGHARISLDAERLVIAEAVLQGMSLEVGSRKDYFGFDKLNFTSFDSRFESQGAITWKGSNASLQGKANLQDVNLDQFLIQAAGEKPVPVSGTAKLASEGKTVGQLFSNFTGQIDLAGGRPGDPAHRRRTLQMFAERISDGMRAEIRTLQWGDSDLTGTLVYHRGTPPRLELEVNSGTLSLEPWEAEEAAPPAGTESSEGNIVGRAARASASFVGRILRAPAQALTAEREADKGDRFFSATALPFDALGKIDLTATGNLDHISSSATTLGAVKLNAKLESGKLDLEAEVGQFNGGRARADIALDTRMTPPTLAVTADFHDVRGLTSENTYTRTGYINANTRGSSQAELAANLGGLFYLKLGPGPFDYANSTLFTADLASSAFRTLIPGIERREPQLQCGVTLGIFKDGHGVTPYGFAARTRQANLLARIELDLRKEHMQVNFDSRSREGVGLSVGNVFSNTVRISGPLNDPQIVPNTTAILWRGWAAFMTAGLSVIGESVLKRALASENPCKSIQRLIDRELCPKSEIARNSGMVCSPG